VLEDGDPALAGLLSHAEARAQCADAALGGAVSFRFSRNIGHIYENMVFLALKRRGNEVFYWKSTRGREVDDGNRSHDQFRGRLRHRLGRLAEDRLSTEQCDCRSAKHRIPRFSRRNE